MKLRKLIVMLAGTCAPVACALAGDGVPSLDQSIYEFGARYWGSWGRNGYNYFGDDTTSLLVSRLTYKNLMANSGEIYFRGDAPWGVFVKGFIGQGNTIGGQLLDEDFSPFTLPYSATTSDTTGKLGYGTIDVGYSLIRQTNVRFGAFFGYGRWNESTTASGCTQIASNPDICQPAVPTYFGLVNENDHWNLLRLGATADAMLGEHLKLTVDAAYVRVLQNAVDDHYYTFGVDPASGSGNGVQLEAILAYQFSNSVNLGVGARWWHMDTNAIDTFDQLLTYKTDRYGLLLQGGYRLN
jgi:hypothetical protein